LKQHAQILSDLTRQNRQAIVGTPDQRIFQGKHTTGVSSIPCIGHSHIVARMFYVSQSFSHPDRKGVPPPGGAAAPVPAAIFLWQKS
ncbi:MAG: hypothetical protein HGA28_05565, partial [Anaerolineaceae bacterium]|nr:hypothetical protein [Anaerolineaceae bacterium]